MAILRKLRGESTKLKAILLAMRVISFRQVASLSVHVSDLTILKKKYCKNLRECSWLRRESCSAIIPGLDVSLVLVLACFENFPVTNIVMHIDEY